MPLGIRLRQTLGWYRSAPPGLPLGRGGRHGPAGESGRRPQSAKTYRQSGGRHNRLHTHLSSPFSTTASAAPIVNYKGARARGRLLPRQLVSEADRPLPVPVPVREFAVAQIPFVWPSSTRRPRSRRIVPFRLGAAIAGVRRVPLRIRSGRPCGRVRPTPLWAALGRGAAAAAGAMAGTVPAHRTPNPMARTAAVQIGFAPIFTSPMSAAGSAALNRNVQEIDRKGEPVIGPRETRPFRPPAARQSSRRRKAKHAGALRSTPGGGTCQGGSRPRSARSRRRRQGDRRADLHLRLARHAAYRHPDPDPARPDAGHADRAAAILDDGEQADAGIAEPRGSPQPRHDRAGRPERRLQASSWARASGEGPAADGRSAAAQPASASIAIRARAIIPPPRGRRCRSRASPERRRDSRN